MNFTGILFGAAVFLCIGMFHPLVIKVEYIWGKKSWWCFLVLGLAFAAISLFVESTIVSSLLGAVAFSCFWSINEVIKQEQRVLRGWFPENPARHEYYESLRKKL